MEFAWNTQKNKISDIKGKEKEQERQGKIRNEDIDLNKTYKNYDLVDSEINLYQRIKKRIDDVRDNSRVQKNSVVSYSNVVTVNKETYTIWGDKKTSEYFEEVYNYFCNEFGKENVVSAKVHLDETTPHMHLHFVPVSQEGKLQARKVMTPSRINKIHSEAPEYLRLKGFDVTRGKGITNKDNIKDIHEYKLEKLIEEVSELENKKIELTKNIKDILDIEEIKDIQVKEKKGLLKGSKIEMDTKDYEYVLRALEGLRGRVIKLEKENFDLKEENSFYKKREEKIFSIKEQNNLIDINNTKRFEELNFREKQISLAQRNIKLSYEEIEKEKEIIEKSNKKINDYKAKVEKDISDKYEEELENRDNKIKKLEELSERRFDTAIRNYFSDKFKEKQINFLKNLLNESNNILDKYSMKYGTDLLDTLSNIREFEYKNSRIEFRFDMDGLSKDLKGEFSFNCEDADKFIKNVIDTESYKDRSKQIKMSYSLYNENDELIHMDESVLDKSYRGIEYLINNQLKEFKNVLINNKDKDIFENILNIDYGLER